MSDFSAFDDREVVEVKVRNKTYHLKEISAFNASRLNELGEKLSQKELIPFLLLVLSLVDGKGEPCFDVNDPVKDVLPLAQVISPTAVKELAEAITKLNGLDEDVKGEMVENFAEGQSDDSDSD